MCFWKAEVLSYLLLEAEGNFVFFLFFFFRPVISPGLDIGEMGEGWERAEGCVGRYNCPGIRRKGVDANTYCKVYVQNGSAD